MIKFRAPSLRQSPAGKSIEFETQISIFAPTARSVNSSNSGPPVVKSISGQTFVVPIGGLSAAAAAPTRAARFVVRLDRARSRNGDLAVPDVDHVAERVVRERGRRHGEREGGQRERKDCSSH